MEERSLDTAPDGDKGVSVSEAVDELVQAPAAPKSHESETRKFQTLRQKSDKAGEEIFVVPVELFEQRGRTFSIINQKGGCGKTTTAINLGAGLAKEGFQVLLIDLDPQAHATLGLGLRLYHLFKEPSTPPVDVIRRTSAENLHLVPSGRAVTSLAVEVLEFLNWEYVLRSYLRLLKPSYHYILIDCPPALNALTINALTASDDMIIPIQTHYFSLEGMKELFLTVSWVREKLNPLLKNGRILPTLFDRRTKISHEMLQAIRDYFKDQVLETIININVRLIESVMQGLSVLSYDPYSRGARDYRALARELIQSEVKLSV